MPKFLPPNPSKKDIKNLSAAPPSGNSFNFKSVKFKKIDEITPYSGNAKVHSRKQISQIAKSIENFGFLNPIIIDGYGLIIAGHGRFEAAKVLGLKQVPTILADHLTDTQKRAYALADNKIAENATWDRDLLRIELKELLEFSNELEIDSTGFSTAEIDLLIGQENNLSEEAPLPPPPKNPVSSRGDLWHLGPHRIFCGDATRLESFKLLLGGAQADLIFTDPPYNVPVNGHVKGGSQGRFEEFSMASGEMTSQEFTSFLNKIFWLSAKFSRDGSLHYICMDWRHMMELLEAVEEIYSEFKNLCVWNKTNGGMGSFYRSKHELVFVFKKGTKPHTNNIELGKYGRSRTNVWDYPGVTSFGKDREETLSLHPTVKPLALVADVVLDASKRGDIVLDPFLGSGTTILAAEQTGRTGYGIEIDPGYVDVTLERWKACTGEEPVHFPSGKSFSEIKKGGR